MKLLSLNIWGGRVYGPLVQYLDELSSQIDIFCFQEVFDTKENIVKSHNTRANIWRELGEIFSNYHKFYYPVMLGRDDKGPVDFDLTSGLAMFVRRSFDIKDEGDYFTYRRRFAPIELDDKDQPNNVQYVDLEMSGKPLQIYNFHGIWFPGDKLDTPERIEQSEKLLEFIYKKRGEKVLCGDFNLMPKTKSIEMLEVKLRNLIKEFKIGMTRSHLNPFRGTTLEQAFADYTFVSEGISVLDFQVPDIDISDHLPMILEFEVV